MSRWFCLLFIAAAPLLAADSELESLRKENAALKARVAELEKQLGIAHQEARQAKAVATQAQQVVQQAEERNQAFYLETKRDSAGNVSSLVSRQFNAQITAGQARNLIYIITARPATAAGPSSIRFNFFSEFSGSLYRDVSELILTADGREIRCPVSDHVVKAHIVPVGKQQVRRDDEKFVATVGLKDLPALSAAKSISGRLGHVTFELDRDQVGTFKAIAKGLGLEK